MPFVGIVREGEDSLFPQMVPVFGDLAPLNCEWILTSGMDPPHLVVCMNTFEAGYTAARSRIEGTGQYTTSRTSEHTDPARDETRQLLGNVIPRPHNPGPGP
jgi:hypothetical protein